jgi:uncharacterized protein (TIGR02099 family)
MSIKIYLKKLKTFLWRAVITVTVALAVAMSAMRIAMPHLAAYIPELESAISAQLNADVKVSGMDSGWQGFGPAIRLEDVAIYQPETNLLLARANHLDVQLNVWASLLQKQLVPGRLTLDGLVLTLVRTEDSSLKIQGFDDVANKPSANFFELVKRFRRVDIKNSWFTVDLLQGEPLDLELKYLSLFPRAGQYRLEADLRHQTAASRLAVIANLHGDITRPKQLSIDGYLNLESIAYDSRFMRFERFDIVPEDGLLSLDTWFKWEDNAWQEAIGRLTLANVLLNNGQEQMNMQLKADIAWQREKKNQWVLSGDAINLQIDKRRSPVRTFALYADKAQQLDLKINAISAHDFFTILNFSGKIPEVMATVVDTVEPEGAFEDIQLQTTYAAGQFSAWQLGTKLVAWQQKAYQNVPALQNLTGELMLKENYGQFTLHSENTVVTSANIFTAPITVTKAHGLIAWHKEGKNLAIKASDLALSTAEFTTSAALNIIVPEDTKKTTVTLKANTADFSADTALRYAPLGILPPKLVDWLQHSIGRGHIDHLQVLLDGPVMEFPFRENQGEFELKIAGADLDLTYHKDWPMLQDVSGEVVVDTKRAQAYLDSAFLYRSKITQAKMLVQLTPITEPLYLTVSGIAEGPAADIEHFLQATPLWPRMQETFEQINIEGSTHLDLDLKLPLRAITEEERIFNVSGTATVKDGEVLLKKHDLLFSQVNGSLNFSEKMLSATDVQGKILGEGALLNVKPEQTKDGYRMDWVLDSAFTPKMLAERFDSKFWSLLAGKSNYTAKFNTYIPKVEEPLQLKVSTDLQGIAVNVPEPFGKTAEQTRATSLTLAMQEDGDNVMQFDYGNILQGLLEIGNTDGDYDVTRGHIVLGDGSLPYLHELEGLEISGHLNSFDIAQWQQFIQEHKLVGKSETPTWSSANVKIDELKYQQYVLNSASVGLQRGPSAWQFNLDSQELVGDIIIPDASTALPLSFDMQRCKWPALRGSTTEIDDPRKIIAFNFVCQDMQLGDRDLGYVKLVTVPQEQGVLFDPVVMRNEMGTIEANGSWLRVDGNTQTHFAGTAATQDLSSTFDSLGITTDIRDAKGDLNFDLKWPGSPLQINKEQLSGEVNARLAKGRIVDVKPGFGRVIGLLSMQGLQRRLRLDFSDIFKEGFSFDSFNGTATIAKGTLYTKDAKIKAPAANIDISGQAGLVSQELDFNIYMKANVDTTVPAVALAIANPIAGAAVWVAGKMINPLSNVGYYHYHVSGTWAEPVFTDLTEEYRANPGANVPVEEVEH